MGQVSGNMMSPRIVDRVWSVPRNQKWQTVKKIRRSLLHPKRMRLTLFWMWSNMRLPTILLRIKVYWWAVVLVTPEFMASQPARKQPWQESMSMCKNLLHNHPRGKTTREVVNKTGVCTSIRKHSQRSSEQFRKKQQEAELVRMVELEKIHTPYGIGTFPRDPLVNAPTHADSKKVLNYGHVAWIHTWGSLHWDWRSSVPLG